MERRLIVSLARLVVVTMLGSAAVAAQEPQAPAARPAVVTVNLNTANAAQLEGLPGIGPKTAVKIIEYREKNGAFKKIEELMNVRGIGEKNFLKLKPLISVAPPKVELTSPQPQR